ncbi:MAG TPA: DUF3137 domain-containing protein [Bacillota bacterium]|nr:DUF3137 domain-containing protein [Bacillota bacterium]
MNDNYKEFNQIKKQSEKNVIIGGSIMAIGVILAVIGNAGQNGLMIVGIIIGIVGLIVLGMGLAKFQNLRKSFKNTVLKKMFEETLPGITYEPDMGLSQQIVYSTDFLKRADRFYSEDYLAGKVDDVDFVSSDVKLEERHVQHTKNGTRVYYVAYFVGRVFRFSFNKDFVGSLQVLEAGSPHSGGYKKVQLESVDFNKKFKTYATEDITAFYILTPDIMEALFKLEQRNPGRIGISFHGEHMYVAINNNKNTFEIQMFRQIDDSMVKEFERDLMVIKDFIMTLKLNTHLFKIKEDKK